MEPLPDGTYDVFIIDAHREPESESVTLELAVTSGKSKGFTVRLQAMKLRREPTDLLGLPATLVVEAGRPALKFDG